MKIFNSVLAICTALIVFVQCAEVENENLDEREQAMFDLWMQKNGPAEAQRYDNGMYIHWIRKAGSGEKLALNNFMYLDYTGYDLNGNLYSTRDTAVAVHENTFSLYTRYTPHYTVFNSDAFYLTKGEYEALAMMSEGDSVHLYLPSMLAYNTAGSTYLSGASFMGDLTYGYTGWYNSPSNPRNTVGGASTPSFNYKPVIIELSLNEIVADPQIRELNDATVAAAALGYNTADTIRAGLFFRYLDDPETGESAEDLASEIIGEDSTFYFEYALRFLDDFLIATNTDTVAYNAWGDYWNTYAPGSFLASSGTLLQNSNTSYYISALNELIKSERVRYNSRMQIIFVSDWAYGPYGNNATSTRPIIYPYVPLKLDITTMEYEYEP